LNNRVDENKTLELLKSNDILELGYLADKKRQEFHPDDQPVTFVVDRNINYTNVCTCKCSFCAFHKDKGQKGTYVLDYSVIRRKIEELIAVNGTQLLLQGGLNPDIPLDYYLNLISKLREEFPDLTIHAFSPAEISFIAKNNNLSPKELLQMFIKSGLSSIPGGGAEILCDEIRSKISPNKISSQEWLDIMETAHSLGLKTTATMVFGFGESYEHIVDHLFKIRDLQDKTGGFTAFICWSFVEFGDVCPPDKKPTSYDYLKIIAVSRLVLDNIQNIQASWVTQGIKVAQLSLRFGANDFGGTMLEENVVKAAGVVNRTTTEEIIYNIQKAGFKPAQRNTKYEILREFC
jgi:cyclic dehypoxanthinyl futalosine synthase